jgi:hypothetical protein
MRIVELKKIMKTKTVTDDMKSNSIMYGLDKVFQNDSTVAKAMTKLRKSSVLFDIVLPFTQTPGNIFDKILD